MMENDRDSGKRQPSNVIMSAPPKIGGSTKSGGKLILQKSTVEGDKGDKVHIPDTFENSESEPLSDRIRRLDGYGDIGQGCSKQGHNDESHRVWCMDDVVTNDNVKQHFTSSEQLVNPKSASLENDKEPPVTGLLENYNNPTEVEISEEAIVNTQESTVSVRDNS